MIENESKLKDFEFKLNHANKSITHYENIIKSHEEETQQTDSQFENVKLLHAEHCKEYEYQIDNLQQQVVNKSKHVVTLEAKMRNLLNEEKKKDVTVKELKDYVEKMDQLLDEKKIVIDKYQDNLEVSCFLQIPRRINNCDTQNILAASQIFVNFVCRIFFWFRYNFFFPKWFHQLFFRSYFPLFDADTLDTFGTFDTCTFFMARFSVINN